MRRQDIDEAEDIDEVEFRVDVGTVVGVRDAVCGQVVDDCVS